MTEYFIVIATCPECGRVEFPVLISKDLNILKQYDNVEIIVVDTDKPIDEYLERYKYKSKSVKDAIVKCYMIDNLSR